MEILIIVVIISFVVKALRQPEEKMQSTAKSRTYEMPKQTEPRVSAQAHIQQQNERWQQAARANIENARLRAQRKVNDLENRFAGEQIRAGRMEAHTTSILDRAKANATENLEDVILNTMEEEHAHSERVSPAEHQHPEDVIPENMLGTIEDLMIKGYDGNLCFERDFVGEALDMLSRFTVPSEVPDFMDTHGAA